MSGNPFRRQPQQAQQAPVGPVIDLEAANATWNESLPPIDTERRSSKAKKVRIATPPPLSPDSPIDEFNLVRRISNESHEGSPPPSPSGAMVEPTSPASLLDPFAQSREAYELGATQEVLDNTRRNSETNMPYQDATGSVANPFQRTLATMEPKQNPYSEPEDPNVTAAATEEPDYADSKPNKGHMDVDSFKRMLLTGNPDSDETDQSTANMASKSYFDYGNSKDGSMPQHPQGRSISEDEPVSPSTPLSEVRNNTAIQPGIGSEKKAKPPPPKHRHGKSVTQDRTPQTVSFSDFAPTESPIQKPASKPYAKALPQVPLPRTPVESNMAATTDTSMKQPLPSPVAAPPAPILDPQTSQQTQRDPPPPPLTRRTSQPQNQRQVLNRENSSSSFSSQKAQLPQPSPAISEHSTDQKPSKPPPPPPTRRGQAAKPATSPENAPSAAPPLPPPTFDSHPSPALPDETPNATSSRSSSIASRNRVSMPPPPPPARRRGSSKSSIDKPSAASLTGSTAAPTVPSSDSRRTSQESIPKATNLGSSNEHLESVAESGDDGSNNNDMRAGSSSSTTGGDTLADIDALRAEVEALRAKYGRSGAARD